jgi:cellulose synthase/poly-beta-1,6-N-acetylglucosamine synthase-like glycosyltransferase
VWMIDLGLGLMVAALSVPVGVLLAECLAALLPEPVPVPSRDGQGPVRTAVLIPAHDEGAGIAGTVDQLLPQLDPSDRLVVIADNCTDSTAERARQAGAEVIERIDPNRRGKGHAIAFGLRQLDADPPDVVVLVDADCRLAEGGVRTLVRQAHAHDRPVQGEYLIAAPQNPTPLSVVSALALLVRNRVRPRGLRRLGLPCHLTGSGMAFPWRVLREAPPTGSELVEDLVMGIEMALMGSPPMSCPAVQVSSELPEADEDAWGQRRRWEHGQLATLVRYGPRLLGRGIRDLRFDLLGLGLDLIVPPLVLLATLLGTLTLGTALGAFLGGSPLPLIGALTAVGGLGLAILAAWLGFGRETLPMRYLLALPAYALWKIPLYLSLVRGRRQRTWERTRRREEGSGGDSGAA